MDLRPTLVGRIVTLEPLEHRHLPDLREAATDERAWTWMLTTDFDTWVGYTLGTDGWYPFAVVRDGRAIGSTSYLNVSPEHGRLEIGNTWNSPSMWGTGANTDAIISTERRLKRRAPSTSPAFASIVANRR